MEKFRRPKSVIILETLLEGQPVHFPNDEHTYMYLEGVFGVTSTRTDISRPDWKEEVLLKVDMSLANFIQLCNSMPDDEIFITGCETVLRRQNRLKAESRRKGLERCRAYSEHWEELGKPEGWLGCSLTKGHEGNHRDNEEELKECQKD